MQLGPDGCLYYPHMFTNEVYRRPLDGGTPELVAADVHEPVAVRFDREGVLMVISRGVEGIITRISPDGQTATHHDGCDVPGQRRVRRIQPYVRLQLCQ
ncbi:hypothetical protein [Kibdelosporangium philippinense]|uniref:hypothetical protein n=1 Tax=Kibdelosporangium philippinense TaxID=211113 RepID=UPI00360A6457